MSELATMNSCRNYITRFSNTIDFRELVKRRIPITNWLPKYSTSNLFLDILAGITVGLTEIPQCIAFAAIASLPPQYGLYSGFMGGFVYAIFGSCKDVNIGPTSIMALMIQPHVRRLGYNMAVIMTFMAGIIIFVLGVLQLGFVVEFFSYPIIAGFTCAAALQIASTQIKSLLGIPGQADAFLQALDVVLNNLDKIRKWDALLGIGSIVFLVVLREIRVFGTLKYRYDWSRKRNIFGRFIFMLSLARNALAVIIGTVLAYCFRNNDEPPFKITGNVDGSFPPFGPPAFSNGTYYDFEDVIKDYGASLAFIPLVAILEAISIAKAFSKGRPLDATQELLALGIANILGSFVRSMPVTGSFTRTAVNNASGVKTPLAGIFTSLLVLLAIGVLTSSFYYVPKATLASVVICAMFYLFDFEAFILIWKAKKLDFVPFLTTLLCCLFISLEYGILIGIGTNLLFVLYSSARPKLSIGKEKLPSYDGDIFVITPKDTLYFPSAEYLRDTVLSCDGNQALIIIDGKFVGNMDVTVAKTLALLVKEMSEKDQKLLFLNFKTPIINICKGINNNLENYFRDGSFEEAVRDADTNAEVVIYGPNDNSPH